MKKTSLPLPTNETEAFDTTAIIMAIKAVTGETAAAAAWSPNEEERRKSIMSFFIRGREYILWDNIPRGLQIYRAVLHRRDLHRPCPRCERGRYCIGGDDPHLHQQQWRGKG
jgi:hypothetical protein